jgi:hypothetical protein
MNSPLKFCVSCGRGITQEDLAHAGLKIQKGAEQAKRISDSGVASGRFQLAKKDHTMHRSMRHVLWSSTIVMVLVVGYYCTMRYVLHEHLPFKMDVMLEQWLAGTGPSETTSSSN